MAGASGDAASCSMGLMSMAWVSSLASMSLREPVDMSHREIMRCFWIRLPWFPNGQTGSVLVPGKSGQDEGRASPSPRQRLCKFPGI